VRDTGAEPLHDRRRRFDEEESMTSHPAVTTRDTRANASLRVCLLTLVAGSVLALAPIAQANTYSATPSDATSLQTALDSAGTHPGDDTVEIPAGTYAGSFLYSWPNSVQIVGAGRAATKLIGAASGKTTLLLDAGGSSVRGLSVAATVGPTSYALRLPVGGTLDDVELRADGTDTWAVAAGGDLTVTNSDLTVVQSAVAVRQEGGMLTMSDSTIHGTGNDNDGIEADSPSATADIARIQVTGVEYPIEATFGASITVRDSLLVLPPVFNAVALSAGDNNNAVNYLSSIQADRLTVVGVPGDIQWGAQVIPNSSGDNFRITIRDSVFTGVDIPLDCSGSPGTGQLTADYSSLPADGDSNVCTSGGISRTHPVSGTPRFVDAAVGDYRLPYDSPLVDAGDPATLAPTLDLGRLPRPVGRRDVGAYEYQRRPPVVAVAASPSSNSSGQPFTFEATATDPDPGDSPLTYSWHFDDGATAGGATVTHAFASAGAHSGTVTVSDPAGAEASATAAVTVNDLPGADVPITSPVTAGDRTPPGVGGFRFSPGRIRLGSALPHLFAAVERRGNIRFVLTEPASVTIRFERRVGKRYARVSGSIRQRAGAGSSRISFSGRLSRRVSLRPGGYRATLTATDAAGNVSRTVSARFTVVR
jgi:hypothetical protein